MASVDDDEVKSLKALISLMRSEGIKEINLKGLHLKFDEHILLREWTKTQEKIEEKPKTKEEIERENEELLFYSTGN